MKIKINFLTAFLALCGFAPMHAQLQVTNTTPEEAIATMLGEGITVFNVTFSGGAEQIGTFNAQAANLGLGSGFMMATGDIAVGIGPNDEGASTIGGGYFGASDPDLDDLDGFTHNDAAILEFDFIATGDTAVFRYIWASEEYPEYSGAGNCGNVSDVFGFFLSGPGINGPFTNNAENIALIPGSDDFVSIFNLNGGCTGLAVPGDGDCNYCELYVHNGTGFEEPFSSDVTYVQYDGFTVVLTAVSALQCGETYHIKMALADVSDTAFDSAVFFESGSFASNGIISVDIDNPPTPNWPTNSFAEDCITGAFEIFVNNADYILADISGTATPGVDYIIDYDMSGDTIFIDSQDSISFFVPIITLSDDIVEGTETITLSFVYTNTCGLPDTATATIDLLDVVPLNLDLAPDVCVCPGYPNSATVNTLNGFQPFTYAWSDGSDDQTLLIDPENPEENYAVTVTDFCGMSGNASIEVNECHPYIITVEAETTLPGLQQNAALEGCVDAVFIVNEEVLDDVNTFTITLGGTATEGTDYILTNGTDYTIPENETEVIIPIEVLNDTQNESNETIIVSINYVNGCGENVVATATMTLVNLAPLTLALPDQTICDNATITVSGLPNGGQGPYTYEWSTGSDDESIDISDYDTYSVTTTDYCGQTATSEFEITPFAPLELSLSEELLDICPVNSTQSTTATVDGGSAPYTYSWTGSNSSNATASYDYNDAGTQEVTVTDQCGTEVTASLEVTIPSLLVLPPFEEWCINDAYDVPAQGGVSPYFVVIDSVFIAPVGSSFYTATDTGYYSITVIDQCGQVSTMDVDGVFCSTVIPNVFTPNSDGENDTFEIFGIAQFPNSEMLIFNRWGNLVFESSSYSNNWNGGDHAEGVYYYVFKRSDGKNFEGYVHLLRD